MLIILFGLSGSGKNFVAEIIAQDFHFKFFDADTILPSEMLECIKHQKMFTQAMRDHYTQLIIHKMSALQTDADYENLVITQALYKEKNRLEIQAAFPDAKFINVETDLDIIQSRLENSSSKVTDPDYAKKISVNFEAPQLSHAAINNNTNKADVLSQLEEILTISPKISRSIK